MKKVSTNLCLFTLFLASCGQNTENKIDSSNTKREIKNIIMNMKTLSSTDDPLVLRTDFSNENEWNSICDEIITPDPEFGFLPNVVFVSHISFQDYTEEQLFSASASKYNHAFIFIVDKITMTNP